MFLDSDKTHIFIGHGRGISRHTTGDQGTLLNMWETETVTDKKQRGYSAIGLHHPQNVLNVGSVLRAAMCYNSSMIAMSGSTPMRLGSIPTDPQKAIRHIPLLRVDDLKTIIPYDCKCIAVDMIDGAIPLQEYIHPERAFYIFGPENGTLSNEVIDWCQDIVYVPTEFCMNLAATVNVVLYDRLAKRFKQERKHAISN